MRLGQIYRVIDGLGHGITTSLGWTIGRPVVASAALAILGPAVTYLLVRPLYRRFLEKHIIRLGGNAALFIGTCVLSAHLAMYVLVSRYRRPR